ncbi:IS481 family transposase, partial [uncultured Desulfosarcina sp.]|uniref:IS481 family transposase n=1 Tax=uncultured Desulfosarcina sp. TaxID=218289 RepID=UPI0029C6AB75
MTKTQSAASDELREGPFSAADCLELTPHAKVNLLNLTYTTVTVSDKGIGGDPMPWKRVDPMDERKRFACEAGCGVKSMSELCREYGISRKTGYKWLNRFIENGTSGCRDKSRAPHSCPHKTSDAVVQRLLELREMYPYWGPRKLVVLLGREIGQERAPAPSTAGAILARHGLVGKRRRKRRSFGHVREHHLSTPEKPNDVWAIDYKGWFRTKDGVICHPLTVTDLHSRFVLWCNGHRRQKLVFAERDVKILFAQYGLPRAIRMDNGSPFGSTGLGGLTRLSLSWVRMNIDLEFIKPGRPQQNGCHERMHKSLKLESAQPPARDLATQQRVFDAWRKRFNEIRPHQGLQDRTPAEFYTPSSQRYTG